MGRRDNPTSQQSSSRGKRAFAAADDDEATSISRTGTGRVHDDEQVTKRRKKNLDSQEPSAVIPSKVASAPAAIFAEHATSDEESQIPASRGDDVPLLPTNHTNSNAEAAKVLARPCLNFRRREKELKVSKKHDDRQSTRIMKKEKQIETAIGRTTDEVLTGGKFCQQACSKQYIRPRHSLVNALIFCLRLIGVGIVAFFMFEMYQQNSTGHYERHSVVVTSARSNVTSSLPAHSTTRDDTVLRFPSRRTSTVSSRHLLELDDYERQKIVLSKTQAELTRVLVDLEKSRHDAMAARQKATNAQDDYSTMLSELDKTQKELQETHRALSDSLDELDSTRRELDDTQRALQLSTDHVENITSQLYEAYDYIEELYDIIDLQESVATRALNFVATEVANQQQQNKNMATHTTSQATKTANSVQYFSDNDNDGTHDQGTTDGDSTCKDR